VTEHVPKVCGGDSELGNFIEGVIQPGGSGREASRAILREIVGVPGVRPVHAANCRCVDCMSGSRTRYDARDWGRKFSAVNGGCLYIDLDHLEVCLPEVRSAHDWVAAWHAMLRLARDATERANERQPDGREIRVLVNNSDGLGHSYGSHLNFLVTRRAYDNVFERKMQHLLWLAAYQASSIVFTGQGKVGTENGCPWVPYQLSQRADFFECIAAPHTTFARPIVNSRDEAHCGWSRRVDGDDRVPIRDRMARLHVIFYDNNLLHVACLLKVGVLQIVLAMIEAEEVDTKLILDDPLQALTDWSHDPWLSARAETCDGRRLTAVELQLLFAERVHAFVESGACDEIVPRAKEIVALWEDTLRKLRDRDFSALTGRLDWVLKQAVIERAFRLRPELEWTDAEAKQLDLVYSDLDPQRGLFWSYANDLMEAVVSESEIERFTVEPPSGTRAWGRAMLLRRAGLDLVEDVDWDYIKFRMTNGYWSSVRRVDMANPLEFTRSALEPLLDRSAGLEEILGELEHPSTGGTTHADTAETEAAEHRSESIRGQRRERGARGNAGFGTRSH
jgi:proteasome accessory factor A